MWVPTIGAPDKWLLPLGIVDALIFLALFIATGVEAGFVPRSKHQCGQLSRNGTAGHGLVFFERAGATDLKDKDYGRRLCREYVDTVHVGVAVL